jgi:hypothetical protein
MASKTDAPEIDPMDDDLNIDDDLDVFDDPAPSAFFRCADNENRIVLVIPKTYETGISTDNGDTDAVRCDVAVLDGEEAGTFYEDTLIFGKVLTGQLKRQIGSKVLGKICKDEANKKKGKNAAWIIEGLSKDPAAVGLARDFLRAQREKANPFAK